MSLPQGVDSLTQRGSPSNAASQEPSLTKPLISVGDVLRYMKFAQQTSDLPRDRRLSPVFAGVAFYVYDQALRRRLSGSLPVENSPQVESTAPELHQSVEVSPPLGKRDLALKILDLRLEGDKLKERLIELRISLEHAETELKDMERSVQSADIDLGLAKTAARFYYGSYRDAQMALPEECRSEDVLPDISQLDVPLSIEASRCQRVFSESDVQVEEIIEESVDEAAIERLIRWTSEEELNEMVTTHKRENEPLSKAIESLRKQISRCKRSKSELQLKLEFLEKEKEKVINIGKAYKAAIDAPIQRKAIVAEAGSQTDKKKQSGFGKLKFWEKDE